jgi:hypothetical protein
MYQQPQQPMPTAARQTKFRWNRKLLSAVYINKNPLKMTEAMEAIIVMLNLIQHLIKESQR